MPYNSAVHGRAIILGLIALWATQAGAATQEFFLDKSEAQSVALMCESNGWKAQPMTKGSNGKWSVKVDLAPGSYAYKFLVNGTDWIFDPANPSRKDVAGVENSSMTVNGSSGFGSASVAPPVTRAASATPTPAPPANAISPSPGEVFYIEAPLNARRQATATREGNAKLKAIKVGLVVPPGFDPRKPWPILVIANTENYDDTDPLPEYKQPASDAGWIVVGTAAADGQKDDRGIWRGIGAAGALDFLATQWPGAEKWPVACGGMSGGAKNCCFVAADLARENRRIIGLLMMGCNQDMASKTFRQLAPPNFLSVPVFMSSGKNDKIAPPDYQQYVKRSLTGTGFQKVRLESFDGAHDIYQPHIAEALQWFAGNAAPSGTPEKPGDFDSFFKKP